MARRKRTLRFLWEVLFPYKIRWGIEEVADKTSSHELQDCEESGTLTAVRGRVVGSVPSQRGGLTRSHNPDLTDADKRQRAS
jgi:hypothetical protein